MPTMDATVRPLLTAAEATERLRISRDSLRRLVATGALPAVRLSGGRLVRFRPEDVEDLIERSRRP